MMKSGPADAMHRRRFAPRDLLLGTQIAICTLLVTASLVAVRGMVRALHAPLRIQPQGAMLADLDLSQAGQAGDVAVEKEKAMIEAVRSIPGVTAAGTQLTGMPIRMKSHWSAALREDSSAIWLDCWMRRRSQIGRSG
jgi:hypothetical protein